MNEETTTNGWVKLYHPTGAQVTFPVSLAAAITTEHALNAFNSVNTLLGAGFSVTAPGLDNGDLVEEVVSVARRAGNDGTPIVAFFVEHPKMVKKFLHTYLNTVEEIADFERATGLALKGLPVFDGDKDITKDHPKADKFIVPLPHPVKVVYRTTDRWKQWNDASAQGQQPQKYELLRYMNFSAPAAQAPIETEIDFEKAGEVLAPGGAKMSSLTTELLNRLINSQNANVTPEMRNAAHIRLKGK